MMRDVRATDFPGPRPTRYMPQLDALRVFAVLAVLVSHNWRPDPRPWMFGDFDWGNAGVRLFFVLSGFLITGILLGCRDQADASLHTRRFFIRQFYVRRFLRIFPVYYLVLALLLVADFGQARSIWKWLVTYNTNIYIAWHHHWIGRVGHFWSLAVEEHFYLVWPCVIVFAPRRWLHGILLSVIALAPLYRLYALLCYPEDVARGFTTGTFTFACLDSLGMGALLAFHAHSQPAETVRRVLHRWVLPIGAGSYVLLRGLWYYDVHATGYFVLSDCALALMFCWLVGSASHGFRGIAGRSLEWKPLVYVGKITYGVYIYHNLVPALLVSVFARFGVGYGETGFVSFLLSAAVTIAIAALSWHLIELPINNLKTHFEYATTALPSVVTAVQLPRLRARPDHAAMTGE